jgi:hypothetical protein
MNQQVTAAAREVVRHFQRYTSEQRANLAASHRAGPRRRAAVGEYYYTHPSLPKRSFPSRNAAAKAAAELSAAQMAASAKAQQSARDAGETDTTKVLAAGAHAAGLVWSAAQQPAPPAADPADEDGTMSRGIAAEIAHRLGGVTGKVYERLALPPEAVDGLVKLVATLPVDEVRRVITRLRVGYDRKLGHAWSGKDVPFRPLSSLGSPIPGTPVRVWEHEGRNEITAVMVNQRTLLEVRGTGGYETLHLAYGRQVIARSAAPGRPDAYMVFWRFAADQWRRATGELTGDDLANWNGWSRLDRVVRPTYEQIDWLDRVLDAAEEDAEWAAAAPPAEPAATAEDEPAPWGAVLAERGVL